LRFYTRIYSFSTLYAVKEAVWNPAGFKKTNFFIHLRKVSESKILVIVPSIKSAIFICQGESLVLTYKKASKIKKEKDHT